MDWFRWQGSEFGSISGSLVSIEVWSSKECSSGCFGRAWIRLLWMRFGIHCERWVRSGSTSRMGLHVWICLRETNSKMVVMISCRSELSLLARCTAGVHLCSLELSCPVHAKTSVSRNRATIVAWLGCV